jgi:hypothetical protein
LGSKPDLLPKSRRRHIEPNLYEPQSAEKRCKSAKNRELELESQ